MPRPSDDAVEPTRFHLFRRGDPIPDALREQAVQLQLACQADATIFIDEVYLERHLDSDLVTLVTSGDRLAAFGASHFLQIDGLWVCFLRAGYVAPGFRGRGLLFELLWESIREALRRQPDQPMIGFCVTRSPRAYASLQRIFEVWPRIDDDGVLIPPEISHLAERIAETSLGDWSLNPSSLVIDCPLSFETLDAHQGVLHRDEPINRHFRAALDYAKAQGFLVIFRGPSDTGAHPLPPEQ